MPRRIVAKTAVEAVLNLAKFWLASLLHFPSLIRIVSSATFIGEPSANYWFSRGYKVGWWFWLGHIVG